MVRDARRSKSCQKPLTEADIEKERHRLRESKMVLVLMAHDLGLMAPRSCCPHAGETACIYCSADWLVANVHRWEKPRIKRA